MKAIWVVGCALLVSMMPVAQAEVSPEKKQLIDELLEVTGSAKMGELMAGAFVQQLTTVLKQHKPDVDPRAFDLIEQEVNEVIHEEVYKNKALNKISYPIYDKHLSSDELDELVRFYRTPIGMKAVSVMPAITQEAMVEGQKWGASLGPRVQKRVEERFAKEGISLE